MRQSSVVLPWPMRPRGRCWRVVRPLTHVGICSYSAGARYPRFVFLKPVQKLHAAAAKLFAAQGESAMAMPSARAAIRLQKFLVAGGSINVGVHDLFAHGTFAVTFPASDAGRAKMYWQHAGEIVSSRLAIAVLDVIDRTCWENTTRQVNDDELEDRASSSVSRTSSVTDDYDISSRTFSSMTSTNPIAALQRRVATLANEDPSNAFVYVRCRAVAPHGSLSRMFIPCSHFVTWTMTQVPYRDGCRCCSSPPSQACI